MQPSEKESQWRKFYTGWVKRYSQAGSFLGFLQIFGTSFC